MSQEKEFVPDVKHDAEAPQVVEDLHKTMTVDTIHGDEAMKVLAAYRGEETWTEQEEKSLRRKIDLKLMSILCMTYGLQYYDKAMLSQAALFGLRDDLDLNVGDRYSFSAAIFYLGFIVGSYPAIVMAQRWPIERVAAGIVILWGACLMSTAGCSTWRHLYVQRFFLGFLESGISPMFMLVVGGWYKKDEQALRMGWWYCCTGYVSIVSPLINYGLGHIKGGSLNSWQYMYLVAGAITILWAFCIYFFMPPDPVRAKGFTDRERYIAVARVRSNNTGVRNTHYKMDQVVDALTDIKFWIMFAMAFLIMIANGPVSTFIPIIISGFGYSTLNSLLLTMPAGVVTGTIEWVVPYIAYKVPGTRSYLIAVCQIGTIVGSFLLWLLPRDQKGGLLVGVYILASFGGGYAVQMGQQIANTAGYTKRSITSSGIFMGYCLGNVVGPLVFKPKDAPRYGPGFIVVLVTAIVAAGLSIVYRLVCMWENKRRDSKGIEAFEHAYDDDLTDRKNPQFRYQL
ncbi:MFS general substrate transporter [Eremomyces bilateralis CBS 781.70]|uniref:MFS general substrate transporter n=1 Tax=Eremomyces bilateralis CBS 781.70 TaxID=1392243 RepID=A0A6G1FTF3_9PEZI|nr:MFS general substrate transporter [Eremomyces bilateralis CBS 781.70]KAF1808941.1 MFS general substrate transporter [Eremomyces bilateralis CBS 781.70]